jgi:hypothetical protein
MSTIKWTDTDNHCKGGAGRVYEITMMNTSVERLYPEGKMMLVSDNKDENWKVREVLAIMPQRSASVRVIAMGSEFRYAAELPTPPARQQTTYGQAWEAGMRYVKYPSGQVQHLFSIPCNPEKRMSSETHVSPSPLGPWVEPLYPFAEGEG